MSKFTPRPALCKCGNTYIKTNGHHTYCPTCSAKAIAASKNRYYKKLVVRQALEDKAIKKAEQGKPSPCDACGKILFCRETVKTQAPLPCFKEYKKLSPMVIGELKRIPASYLAEQNV